MASAPAQILSALQTTLQAGSTAAGTRVFVDRVDPLQATELPAVLLSEGSAGESASQATLHGMQERTLQVQVECVLAGATAAALVRDFGVAVEKIIASGIGIARLLRIDLQDSRPTLQGDGDRMFSVRSQTWEFAYMVQPTAPDIIL